MKSSMTILLLSLSVLGFAQSLEREVVSSSGDYSSSSSGNLSSTVGETITETTNDGTNELTQGFQQSDLSISSINYSKHDVDIKVYPNPITSCITIETVSLKNITAKLYTGSGKQISESMCKEETTHINMSKVVAGTYVLTLSDSKGELIETVNIIKAK